MRKMPAQKPGESKQDYGTPRDFLDAVEKRFGPMAVDLAARKDNAKAPLCITPEQDSLKQDWGTLRGNLWLNPPYENIAVWAKKCAETETGFRCKEPPEKCTLDRRIFFLVPASIGSNWFAQHVDGKARVLALNGRITFEGCTQPYPKDAILACYGETPGFEVWRWK